MDPLQLVTFKNAMHSKYPNMSSSQRKSLDDYVNSQAMTGLAATGNIPFQDFAKSNPTEAYGLLGAGFTPSSAAVDPKTAQKGQALSSQVDVLESFLSKSEGRGLVSGGLANIFAGPSRGAVNPNTYQFNELRSALIAPLARVISGESGQLNEGDIKRAESLLPRIEEGPEVAAQKLQTLRNALNAVSGGGGGMSQQQRGIPTTGAVAQGQVKGATADEQKKNFVQSVIEAITNPFTGTAKTIGGAAFETGRALTTSPSAQRGENVNPFLTDEELTKYATDPTGQVLNQAGRSAALVAYGVPVTKATSLAGRTLPALGRVKGGALVGALAGAGQETGSNLGARAGNVAKGAAMGAVIGVIANKLAGKKQPQLTPEAELQYSDTLDDVQRLSPETQNTSALAKAGRDLVSKQYNVPRNAAMRLHLRETVQQLDDYGLRNIDKVRQVVPKVTGDTGVLTKITRDAVQSNATRPIRLDGLLNMADDIAADPSLPPGVDTKFVNFLKKGVTNLPNTKSPNAALSQVGDPSKTFDFIQSLESQAAKLVSPKAYGVIPENNVALSNSYRLFADELKTRLFYESGADDVVVNLVANPKYLTELQKVSPKLAQQAQQATSVADIRHLAAPFVRAGQAIQITDAGEFLVFNNLVDAVNRGGNILSKITNIPGAIMQTNQARSGVGGFLMQLGAGARNTAQQATAPIAPALNSPGGNAFLRLLTTGAAGKQ